MPDFYDDLRLAHVLADAADAVTMERFKALDLKVETKPDMTPVSEADKAAEELIRGQLQRARPRDAVLGEEFGAEGGGERRWIVDPIDGTKNYVRGVPVWATLIALAVRGAGEEGDDGVVGLVSAPALGRRWWASTGGGAYTGRSLSSATRLHVSRVDDLADASFAYSSLSGWEERGRLDAFLGLTRACWRTRGYGDFWSYMMVAEGSVDICAEPELSLWDMAAPSVVVREAGGRFTSLDGRPGPYGGDAAASNGLLHPALLRHLGGGAG
ncbi:MULTISPECIES: histidinol-phosphatase [Streptomycetaceae]|nr:MULTISPECIES: histidinol-phosphatase [Streptomycetaceae]MYS60940.1 histidinol-phosphatase [Streptomyces sp. SID5468]CCB76768.1 putative fructose-1,6-bisphosphatase and related enzymes of inositol monophosphatase family [Streptantibioticus cattleyicolor NRRL 8057 = DSM 46488]